MFLSIDIDHLRLKLGPVPNGLELFRHGMIDEQILFIWNADVHLGRFRSHDLRIHRLLVQQNATTVRLGDQDGRTSAHGLQLHGLTVDNVHGGHDVREHQSHLRQN